MLSFFIRLPLSFFSYFTIEACFCQLVFCPEPLIAWIKPVSFADTKAEVIKMSPKELLYIEDALGHTQFLMNQCRNAANQLSDPALRQQVQQLVNGNQKLFTQFYNLV